MILRRAASGPRSVICTLLCGLALAGQATQAAPEQQAPEQALLVRYPEKALLLDVTRAGARLVAVGVHGVIITSDDNGTTWSQASVPVSGMLTCVAFSDARRGWAAGHNGVILATVDAGTTWTRVAAPTSADDSFLDLLPLHEGRILVAGAYGLFLTSKDGGATWEKKPALEEDMHINRLTRGPSGSLYLAAEAGTLAVSSDLGETWEHLESPYEGSFFGLHELASGRLLAHGLRGHVFTSNDRGATWQPARIDHSGLLATAAEATDGTIAVSGAGGKIFISRDGGATFVSGPPTGLTATAELVAANGILICVGDSGARAVTLPQP